MKNATTTMRGQFVAFAFALSDATNGRIRVKDAIHLLALARALKAVQRDDKPHEIEGLLSQARSIVEPFSLKATLEIKELVIYGDNLHIQVPTL